MPNVAHSKKTGWGGKRSGAGRKRTLPEKKDRQSIAFTYYLRMQRIPTFRSGKSINAADVRPLLYGGFMPRREAVIRKLAVENRLTRRMIERIISEFLPRIRREVHAISEIYEGYSHISDSNLPRWRKTLKFYKLSINRKKRKISIKYAFLKS